MTLSRIEASIRRELVFLALGTMDICVITPIYGASLVPLIEVSALGMSLALVAAVMLVHYLARLSFSQPFDPRLRSGLILFGMLVTGLLAVHHLLYPEIPLWGFRWLGELFHSIREDILAPDLKVFFLVVFLWWRGLVLAQRRLVSSSVAFRFRLGVVLLAVTSGVAGSMLSWPYHHLVFLFFFASLLGIALARAQEVSQHYGGQSPFDLGWLAALLTATAVVLLMAAGFTSLLTGETIGRVLTPVLRVLQILLFVVIYLLAWMAQLVIDPLLAFLQRYEVGQTLDEIIGQWDVPPPTGDTSTIEPIFTPEQLATTRLVVGLVAAATVLVVVSISLYRLRARSVEPSDEVRESVWEGVQLRAGLGKLLGRGRRQLNTVTKTLSNSYLGRAFAALTIRRIYAHLGFLAAKRGYPRAHNETPYDYLPTLKRAFPESWQEVTQITESYVVVHYGEMPERQADLSEARSAWKRIQRRSKGQIEHVADDSPRKPSTTA